MTERSPSPYQSEPASFSEMLGTEVLDSGEGWARVRMPIRQRHLQAQDNVQGGIMVALADEAFHRALQTTLPPSQIAVTVELKVNFIAPAREGELVAVGRIAHKGRTLAIGEMPVTDGNGALIAKGLGTWILLQPRE